MDTTEEQTELYAAGWDRFPWWWILGENLFFFAPLAIGFLGMWPLGVYGIPVVSLAYVLFAFATVGWLLRKHVCTHCVYYDEWCHLGWGKYAALFWQRRAGNPALGFKLTAVYMILPLIPIVGIVVVLFLYGFSWVLAGALALFIVLNGVQFAVVRPRGCRHCKLCDTCPGSAASGRASRERK